MHRAKKALCFLFSIVFVVQLPLLAHAADKKAKDYNIQAGPVEVKVVAGVRNTYSDNINLSEFNRLDDFIVTPYVKIATVWPMTQSNTLRVGLGISYDKHINHPEADSKGPLLTPDSETGFNFEVKAGDFLFNLYDHISYQQDPIDNGSISNSFNYGRFINRAGIDATWYLNDVELLLGVYQENYWSTSNEFEYLDRSTQGVRGKATFKLGSETTAGIQGEGTLNDYSGDIQNDGQRLSVGPFIRSKLSESISVGASAALELGQFDRGGLNGDDSDLFGYSFTGDISHRVNRFLKHDLLVARNVDLGTYSNYTEMWEARYNTSWNIIQNVQIGTTAFIELGDDSSGFGAGSSAESYMRYGAGASIGYGWTKHLTTSLSYLYTEKNSDLFGRDYYQNKITLDLRYSF